jgi:hypothetical protein
MSAEAEPEPSDPGPARAGHRPLGPLATLAAALRLYRDHAGALLGIVAVVVMPLQVFEVVIYRQTIPAHAVLLHGTLYLPNGTEVSAAPRLIYLLISSLVGLIDAGALYWFLIRRHLGAPASAREALGAAADRWLALLGSSILLYVLVGVGLVTLVLPGLYAIVALLLTFPSVMVEPHGPLAALAESFDLVVRAGNWWRTLGRLFLSVLIAVPGALVLLAADRLASGAPSILAALAINAAAEGLLVILLTPLLAAVVAVTFVDYRGRAGQPLELAHDPLSTSIGLS